MTASILGEIIYGSDVKC